MQSCSSYTSHNNFLNFKGSFYKEGTMEEKKFVRLTETVQSAG